MADKDIDKNIYDQMDLGDVPKASGPKLPAVGFGKFIAIAAGFLVVVVIIAFFIFSGNSGTSQRIEAAKNLPIAETDSEVNTVKTFAAKFLDKFYWYNRDSYMDIRKDLEKMMTTNLLEKYKIKYYDNAFEQDIIDADLIISPTYDAIMYKKDGDKTYVRILGDIKYEDGRTGASRTRVSTWTLTIVNQDGQNLVDDFKIAVGK
jgi:hypothetical protein